MPIDSKWVMAHFDHQRQIILKGYPHLRLVDIGTDMEHVLQRRNLSPSDAIVDERSVLLQIPESLAGDKGESALGLVEGPVGWYLPTEVLSILHDRTGDLIDSLLTADNERVALPTIGQRPRTVLLIQGKADVEAD